MAEHVVREQPHLILLVDLADGGQPLRFGPEEAEVDGILASSSFETSMPGGFGPGDFRVTRPDDFDPLSLGRGLWAGVRLIDSAGRKVYEGRVASTPKTGANELTIRTEGHAKITEDNETAQAIFRDFDLNQWTGPSAKRKLDFIGSSYNATDPQVTQDPTNLASALEETLGADAWAAANRPVVEGTYDAGPANRITQMYAAWQQRNLNPADPNWQWDIGLGDTDLWALFDISANLRAAGPGSVTLNATTTTRRFALARHMFNAAGGTAGSNTKYSLFWTTLAVYCTSLTKRGTEPAAGFYVSDMLAYIFSKFCPQLTVNADSIEGTNFVVPQMAFRDDTTPRTMIEAMLLLGGVSSYPLDWMVYDDKTVKVASPGNYGSVWNLRKDEGSPPDNAGPDASQRPNAVKASWDDGSGKIYSVAPSGIGSDYVDSSLLITDPTHPANTAGLQVYKSINVGVGSQAMATLFGQLYLSDKNRQEWVGSIEAEGEDGFVRDSSQNEQPVYMIRSGDRAVLGDDNDTRERRIVNTSYDSEKRATKVDIGPKPGYFETLLAQAGVLVSPIGAFNYANLPQTVTSSGSAAPISKAAGDVGHDGSFGTTQFFGSSVGLSKKKKKK